MGKSEYKGIDLSQCEIMTVKALVVGTAKFSPLKISQFINSLGSEVKVSFIKFQTEHHISTKEFKETIDRIEKHGFERPTPNPHEPKDEKEYRKISGEGTSCPKCNCTTLTHYTANDVYECGGCNTVFQIITNRGKWSDE
ncbi:hypothetical protein KAU43_03690 [candidate division WOR-3 bacterium]|nr:hypothetical protein [candidate division WOR-3 bacterium]